MGLIVMDVVGSWIFESVEKVGINDILGLVFG